MKMESGTYDFNAASSNAGEIRTRQTAYKIWLSDLKERAIEKVEGHTDFILVGEKRVSRVNVVASVVDKFLADNYASLTLDDGSAQLRLKAFGDFIPRLREIEAGDIILTIARIREYNNETYILPEIIKKVTSKHALLRRLELILEYGKRDPGFKAEMEHEFNPKTGQVQPQMQVQEKSQQQIQQEESNISLASLKEKIKIQLAKLDEGEGVELTLLEQNLTIKDKEKVAEAIDELLGEGEAYEPRPGKIRLI